MFLRTTREAQRLTQEQVSAMTKGSPWQLSRAAISAIERGQNFPGMEAMLALSTVLYVDPKELIERARLSTVVPLDISEISYEDLDRKASQYFWAGDFRKALSVYDAMLEKVALEALDESEEVAGRVAKLEVRRATALKRAGAMLSAIATAERAISLSADSPETQARAYVVLAVLARPFLRADGPAFTSIFQGAIRLNAYIGFAFAFTFYGTPGLTIAAVFVALMMPIVNTICVAVLVAYGSGGRASWSGVAIGVATNPLILACLAGAALNLVAGAVPGWVTGVLGILAQAALPLALLCVGAGLDFSSLNTRRWIILATSAYKLAVLPVLAWGIVELTGLTGVSFAVVMLFAATPASPSTYVMARQLGGDAGLMAGIVTAQTALSVFSISVVLVLIGNLAAG